MSQNKISPVSFLFDKNEHILLVLETNSNDFKMIKELMNKIVQLSTTHHMPFNFLHLV